SETLFYQAGQLLLSEANLMGWQSQSENHFIKNYTETQTSFRIDAEHFQPKYDSMLEVIKTYSNGYINFLDIVCNSMEMVEPRKNPEIEYNYIELSNINQSSGTIE